MSTKSVITKFRCRDNDEEEPIEKVPRVLLVKFEGCPPRGRVLIPTLNLCQLPSEILQKIIGCINIWHHCYIRCTSRRLRDIDDTYIMHEFQKAYQNYMVDNPFSYGSAALRCIKLATEVYVKSGFASTFCGCILPMLRSSYQDPFCPRIHNIQTFLIHFYDIVDERMGDATSQKSRLLYGITLVRFFKAFEKAHVVSSIIKPLHWRTVVEFKGPWLGILWYSKHKPCQQSPKRSNLLVILAEMLIADITGRAFRRVWERSNEIYVFGNDTSNHKRIPRTLFTFTVHGSKKICSLFRSCLEDDVNSFHLPAKWPKDQFSVNLDITCREAMKWGCSKSQHMDIGPFAQAFYSEDDDLSANEDVPKLSQASACHLSY